MTTNGMLLQRYMDYLVENDFQLLISLDGNEYNTSYRTNKAGKPAYPHIIKNVNALREKYPVYFEQNVNFNAVLHNRNSVGSIYDFFKTQYNKIPSIGELNNIGIRPDKIELFRKTYRNSNESLHQSENYELIEQDMFVKSGTYRSATIFLHRYSGYVYSDYTDLLFGQREKTVPTGTCLPFGKKMFVTVNGKILPCERIGQQFALGTVSEQEVKLDFQAIADKYNSCFAKLERQCSKCYKANACIQCIFNLHNPEDSPVCYGFTDEQAFAVYKKKQMDFFRKHPEDYYRIMELNIYLHTACEQNCLFCNDYFRQSLCCCRTRHTTQPEMLNVANLQNILLQIRYGVTGKINLIGGNLLKYTYYKELSSLFAEFKERVHLWNHYANFSLCKTAMPDFIYDVPVTFPVKENAWEHCLTLLSRQQVKYRFFITGPEEYKKTEVLIEKHKISNYTVRPVYTKNNLAFFEESIYSDREDIFQAKLSFRQIFAHQKLNTFFFGSLTILPNGKVKANVNTSDLGSIFSDTLLDIINKEMLTNTAWRKIRNMAPCSDCRYQYLCPSPANYELAIGKPDLCHIKK